MNENHIRAMSIMTATRKIENMKDKDKKWRFDCKTKLDNFVIFNMYDPPKLGFAFDLMSCKICGHTEWLPYKIPTVFPIVCPKCGEQEIYIMTEDEIDKEKSSSNL